MGDIYPKCLPSNHDVPGNIRPSALLLRMLTESSSELGPSLPSDESLLSEDAVSTPISLFLSSSIVVCI